MVKLSCASIAGGRIRALWLRGMGRAAAVAAVPSVKNFDRWYYPSAAFTRASSASLAASSFSARTFSDRASMVAA